MSDTMKKAPREAFAAFSDTRKKASIEAFAAFDAGILMDANTETIKMTREYLKEIDKLDLDTDEEKASRSYAKLLAAKEIKKLLEEKQKAHEAYLKEAENFLKSFQSELKINLSEGSSPTPEDKKRFQEAIKKGCYDDLFANSYEYITDTPKKHDTPEHWFVYVDPEGCTPRNEKAKNTAKQLIEELEIAEKEIIEAENNYQDNGTIGSDVKTSEDMFKKLKNFQTKDTATESLARMSDLLENIKFHKFCTKEITTAFDEILTALLSPGSSVNDILEKKYASLNSTAQKLPQPDNANNLSRTTVYTDIMLKTLQRKSALLNPESPLIEKLPKEAMEDLEKVRKILKETSSSSQNPSLPSPNRLTKSQGPTR